jgi:hypothetical protein
LYAPAGEGSQQDMLLLGLSAKKMWVDSDAAKELQTAGE